MQDKIYEIFQDYAAKVYDPAEAQEKAGEELGRFVGGFVLTQPDRFLRGALGAAWELFRKGLRKPAKKRHYGNCTSGFTLELLGEDDDYMVLVCVPHKTCYHVLQKKRKEAANADDGGLAELFNHTKDKSSL